MIFSCLLKMWAIFADFVFLLKLNSEKIPLSLSLLYKTTKHSLIF